MPSSDIHTYTKNDKILSVQQTIKLNLILLANERDQNLIKTITQIKKTIMYLIMTPEADN